MKLCYRGVEYDYNPPSLEVQESELTGCYRGRPITFTYVSHVPVPQPVATMTYRGAGYTTTPQGKRVSPLVGTVDRTPVFQSIQATDNSVLKARRHLLKDAAEAHRLNMQRSLERRIAVARSQGNSQLLAQLEAELHQLV